MGPTFVYPWSTHSILFDYKVPCNATTVDDVDTTFDRYLQGLSLEFIDEKTDTAVFKLLQDIPPEWDVVYAGWDATPIADNFTYADVNQPLGDVQKVVAGRCDSFFFGFWRGGIEAAGSETGPGKGKENASGCSGFPASVAAMGSRRHGSRSQARVPGSPLCGHDFIPHFFAGSLIRRHLCR